MRSALISVEDSTRVAEARRIAATFAQSEGLAEQATEETAIIATEIATNLLKHARSGEVHLSCLSAMGDPGVEILSIDRGPGMGNLQACAADGFSTTGTSGTGLGAIFRLADVFDAFSQPRRGTVLVARKFLHHGRGPRPENWTFGAVRAPYPGESACGDNWSIRRDGQSTILIVADGLGHGVLAGDASTAAVAAFQKGSSPESATAILENVHLALRSTRGAAVSVAYIEQHSRVHYAGLGNVAGVLLGGARAQFMVSHNGTAGLEARRFQEFDYPLPPEGAIVMHSDGLTTSWSMDAYPGLIRRHPALIAGVLYRDASRGRDDVCVLVGRYIRECR
jgi:anti-sigma regulatory factor (Ser/Thr protein kinase)